jgi:hypothetical protein
MTSDLSEDGEEVWKFILFGKFIKKSLGLRLSHIGENVVDIIILV